MQELIQRNVSRIKSDNVYIVITIKFLYTESNNGKGSKMVLIGCLVTRVNIM